MSSPVVMLSKSDYRAGLDCLKKVWLKKHRPDLRAPLDAGAQKRLDDGNEVGLLARRLFPKGVLMPSGDVQETLRAIENGAETLFEASFEAEGFRCRADVLSKEAGKWVLYEVKSSKSPKPSAKKGLITPKPLHVQDVAFQRMVARAAGIDVSECRLILLDRDFLRDGEVLPEKLFRIIDVTELAEKVTPEVRRAADEMLESACSAQPPGIETNVYCFKCEYQPHCAQDRHEQDLVFLPSIKSREVEQLRQMGYRLITDVPVYDLGEGYQRAAEVVQSGRDYFGEELRGLIESWPMPLHFIDFETLVPCVPIYEGTRPHQPLPFQWSCHILRSPNAEPEHREFLHHGEGDPRHEFAETLWQLVREAPAAVVYSGYEEFIAKGLVHGGIRYGRELLEHLTSRSIDLLEVMKDHVYMRAFQGFFSIKTVLPIMAPHLSYDRLAIQEGMAASVAFSKLAGLSPAEREQTRRDLLEYCKMDTLAMVELYRALRRVAPG